MIDEEKTFAEKGYYSTDLKHNSHKHVYAVCDGVDCQREGGRGRWVIYQQYRDLCFKCAHKICNIQKCETSTEKLPWVDDDITFREKGYRSTELKPGSTKPVWAICQGENCEREGGRGRWVAFRRCSSLCHLCSIRTKEFRDSHAEIHKRENLSEYTLKKMRDAQIGKTGESAGNWQGGKSFEPYCEKFNKDFKDAIREKFGWLCFMCIATEEKNGQKLSVHHVNYDKECICNGNDCEFVPLCMKCHGKTNGNRELWERLIINVLWYEGWI